MRCTRHARPGPDINLVVESNAGTLTVAKQDWMDQRHGAKVRTAATASSAVWERDPCGNADGAAEAPWRYHTCGVVFLRLRPALI